MTKSNAKKLRYPELSYCIGSFMPRGKSKTPAKTNAKKPAAWKKSGRRGETKGGHISAATKRRKISVSESDTLKRIEKTRDRRSKGCKAMLIDRSFFVNRIRYFAEFNCRTSFSNEKKKSLRCRGALFVYV